MIDCILRIHELLNEIRTRERTFGQELCADAAASPPPPTECRRRSGAVFVTCSRHVVHQL